MTDRKSFAPFDFKLSETGEVTVAFSRFNVIDKDKDVTFAGSMPVGKAVPMSAYGHTSWDGALPIGRGVIREAKDLGILDGQFFMDTDQGRNGYNTVKAMAELQEWSYAYAPLPPSGPGVFEGQQVRELRKLDVSEISPVLVGAGEGTHTLAIKSGAPEPDASIAVKLSWYTEGLPAVFDYFTSHVASRASEGRKLSRSDRAAIEEFIEAFEAGLITARDLVTGDDPPKAMVDPVTLDVLLGLARANGVAV
jgi:hypothetical protein